MKRAHRIAALFVPESRSKLWFFSYPMHPSPEVWLSPHAWVWGVAVGGRWFSSSWNKSWPWALLWNYPWYA